MHRTLVLAAILLTGLATPFKARAEWQPDGTLLVARTGAVTAPDGRGGVFAATGYPEHATLIYRMSAAGDTVAGWPRAGRDLAPEVGILEHYSIAPVVILSDGAGGTFLLTAEQTGYQGSGGFLYPVQFYVHRRTAAGDPAPGWTSRGVLLSTPVVDHRFEVHHLPTMVADGRGGVLVPGRTTSSTSISPTLLSMCNASRVRELGPGARTASR